MFRSSRLSPGLVLFLPLLLGLVPGCADPAPKVVRVNGTVSHQGQPVPHLQVNFVPGEGPASWGMTDENGRYELYYSRKNKGAVRGKHKVSIAIRPRNPQEEMELQEGTRPLPPYLLPLLEKYGNQATTPLTFDITRDGQVIAISLD